MKFPFSRLLLSLFFLSFYFSVAHGQKKVKLADVTALTFHEGRMTTAKRGSPIPQTECRGSYCSHAPETIQCHNVGSDGLDVQWKCDAELDERYKFGDISVNCEGYTYPDDPYVTAGSCGVQYTLELSEKGKTRSSHRYKTDDYEQTNDYYQSTNDYPQEEEPSHKRHFPQAPKSSMIGNIFIFLAVGAIIYAIWKIFLHNSSGRTRSSYVPGAGYSGSGVGGVDGGYSANAYGGGANTGTGGGLFSTASNLFGKYANPSATSSGPGFWSGAATGAGLGYLFGRRGGSSAATVPAYATRQNARSSTVRTSPTPTTRTATGFANTQRR